MKGLSVIIPAWQAEKYIKQAVDSVRNQGWAGDVEIILCDDGSTDKTAEIAEELGCIVLHNDHKGAATARNAGLGIAKNELILLLDADDRLVDGALSALYAPMKEDESVQAVFAKAVDFISEELTEEQKSKLVPRKESYGGVLPGCSLIKKSVFDEVGLFNAELKSGETVAWLMKLRDAKLKVVNLDVVVLERRLHLTNTGRLFQADERKNYAALLRARMKKK